MNVNEDKIKSINGCEILSDLKAGKEIIWINPDKTDFISACILKAEIVNVSVDESVLTDGKVDLSKVKPIAFGP